MAFFQLSPHNILRHMRRRPLRTTLTLLQLVLSTLAMVVAVSLYLSDTSQRGKGEVFSVSALTAGQYSAIFLDGFQQQDIPKLLELAPDVQALALFYPGTYRPSVAVANDLFILPRIAEVSRTYFDLMEAELVSGSFFTSEEVTRKAKVIVLSDATATVLFGDVEPLGQELMVFPHGEPTPITYQVIGIFKDRGNINYDSGRVFAQAPAYIPTTSVTTNLLVLARPGAGAAAREQIIAASRRLYPRVAIEGEFLIDEPVRSSLLATDLNPNVIIFGLFGIIAFVLGAVGIFSQSVVAIAECMSEIGVRRTLGASQRHISFEFMAEAGMLAFLGGLVGMVLAALLVPPLASWIGEDLFSGIHLDFRPLASLAVLGSIVIVSAVLGFFPAWRAGKLHPIESLHEA